MINSIYPYTKWPQLNQITVTAPVVWLLRSLWLPWGILKDLDHYRCWSDPKPRQASLDAAVDDCSLHILPHNCRFRHDTPVGQFIREFAYQNSPESNGGTDRSELNSRSQCVSPFSAQRFRVSVECGKLGQTYCDPTQSTIHWELWPQQFAGSCGFFSSHREPIKKGESITLNG